MSKEHFIAFMRECGALSFGDFTLKSGRRAPYFINSGAYRTGAQLARLGAYYADLIHNCGQSFDALFGPAYKGIPLAAAAAVSLYQKYGADLPYFFNRKEAKDHGEGGVIVGYTPKPGDKIAIIEDVVTAGTAVRESIALLTPLGVTVNALFVSVDRCEKGNTDKSALRELHEELNIGVYSIVTSRDILESLPDGGAHKSALAEYLSTYAASS